MRAANTATTAVMKEDQHHHHHHHHHRRLGVGANSSKPKYAKPTAYAILLLLSYALGYFSATSSFNPYHFRPNTATASNLNQSPPPPPPSDPQPDLKTDPKPDPTTSESPPPSQPISDHDKFSIQCSPPIPHTAVRQTIIDQIYNGTSPFENFPPPHIAPLLQPLRLKGWGSYGAVFSNLITRTRPKTIIEVGTFLGASALHMANLTLSLGDDSADAQILCLDDFRGWAGYRSVRQIANIPAVNGDVLLLHQFMQNAVAAGFEGRVMPVPFSTASGLDRLCEWGVFGDLIEVDAGHDFHSAWGDINRAFKVLRPGGVLFGHDYFTAYDDRGVRRAVNLFARSKGLRVTADGQHWVISP